MTVQIKVINNKNKNLKQLKNTNNTSESDSEDEMQYGSSGLECIL